MLRWPGLVFKSKSRHVDLPDSGHLDLVSWDFVPLSPWTCCMALCWLCDGSADLQVTAPGREQSCLEFCIRNPIHQSVLMLKWEGMQ